MTWIFFAVSPLPRLESVQIRRLFISLKLPDLIGTPLVGVYKILEFSYHQTRTEFGVTRDLQSVVKVTPIK